MQSLSSRNTTWEGLLCEAYFQGQQQAVYMNVQLDHRKFSTPQRLLPFEDVHCEWVEVLAELYFSDQYGRDECDDAQARAFLGSVMAWYYPGTQSLTVWGVTGVRGIKEDPDNSFASDRNVKIIWQGMERFLLEKFPHTTQITALAKPFSLADENELWQEFLAMQRYAPDPSDTLRFVKKC